MHLNPAGINMGKGNPVADLDAQIYAQIRSYHFLKWNKIVPGALLRESGPGAYSYYLGTRNIMAVTKSALNVIQNTLTWTGPTEDMDVCKEADGVGVGEEKSRIEGSREEKNGQNDDDDDNDQPKFNKSLCWYLPQQDTNAEVHSACVIEDSLDYTRSTVAEILSEAIYSVSRDHEKVRLSQNVLSVFVDRI